MAVTPPLKRILEENDELCRILGYGRSELLQRTWPSGLIRPISLNTAP
jgi:PAS domain-containing protein